jgi:hypothetical protein
LADIEVRPSTDNVQEVASANDLTVSRADINVPSQELESLINLSDPNERKRVDELKKKISSDNGFISRVIIDGQNNVVEGQHRVQAMKELGYDFIPVVQLKGINDFIPNSDALNKIMQDAGLESSDKRYRMRQIIAEIISDENGDVSQLREYDAPSGLETAWNAAIEEVIRQNAAPSSPTTQPTPAAPTPTTETAAPAATTEAIAAPKAETLEKMNTLAELEAKSDENQNKNKQTRASAKRKMEKMLAEDARLAEVDANFDKAVNDLEKAGKLKVRCR